MSPWLLRSHVTFPANSAQAMVFISVWLTLVVNKYFAVSQCAHAWQIENVCRDFWKGQTNFVSPVRPEPNRGFSRDISKITTNQVPASPTKFKFFSTTQEESTWYAKLVFSACDKAGHKDYERYIHFLQDCFAIRTYLWKRPRHFKTPLWEIFIFLWFKKIKIWETLVWAAQEVISAEAEERANELHFHTPLLTLCLPRKCRPTSQTIFCKCATIKL